MALCYGGLALQELLLSSMLDTCNVTKETWREKRGLAEHVSSGGRAQTRPSQHETTLFKPSSRQRQHIGASYTTGIEKESHWNCKDGSKLGSRGPSVEDAPSGVGICFSLMKPPSGDV